MKAVGGAPVGMASGLLLVGLSGYVFLAVTGHSSSPTDAAALSSLYFLVGLVTLGVFAGLEQETSRAVSRASAEGRDLADVTRTAQRHAVALLGACLFILLAVSPVVVPGPLRGQWALFGALAVAAGSAAAVYLVRGLLGGRQLFGGYAATLAVEGLARLLPCVVIFLVAGNAAWAYGLAFALALSFAAGVGVRWLRAVGSQTAGSAAARTDIAWHAGSQPIGGAVAATELVRAAARADEASPLDDSALDPCSGRGGPPCGCHLSPAGVKRSTTRGTTAGVAAGSATESSTAATDPPATATAATPEPTDLPSAKSTDPKPDLVSTESVATSALDDSALELSEFESGERSAAGSLLLLVAASLLTQLVANLPPLVASTRLAHDDIIAAGFGQAFVLVRIPLLLTAPIQAMLLPALTRSAARNDHAALRHRARVSLATVAGLGAFGTVVLAGAGPWVLRVFFGTKADLSHELLGSLGVGTVFLMLTAILQPTLVALNRHRLVPLAWGIGAVVLTGAVVLPISPLHAAAAGSIVGPVTVVAVMALGLRDAIAGTG